jgi:hypothetical protein
MRIIELLEGKNFKDLDFVKEVGDDGKRELNYDLTEDLMFYMNNDDEAYRRHLYPIIAKCIDIIESKKRPKSSMFEKAIRECYKMYTKEYSIRELPHELDEKIIKETCDKLQEEICQHINDGRYK